MGGEELQGEICERASKQGELFLPLSPNQSSLLCMVHWAEKRSRASRFIAQFCAIRILHRHAHLFFAKSTLNDASSRPWLLPAPSWSPMSMSLMGTCCSKITMQCEIQTEC